MHENAWLNEQNVALAFFLLKVIEVSSNLYTDAFIAWRLFVALVREERKL
jgi:hypothetical protein